MSTRARAPENASSLPAQFTSLDSTQTPQPSLAARRPFVVAAAAAVRTRVRTAADAASATNKTRIGWTERRKRASNRATGRPAATTTAADARCETPPTERFSFSPPSVALTNLTSLSSAAAAWAWLLDKSNERHWSATTHYQQVEANRGHMTPNRRPNDAQTVRRTLATMAKL